MNDPTMKTNLKFWIPIGLLVIGLGVLGWQLFQQSTLNQTLGQQYATQQTRIDSLLKATHEQKQTIASNQEDKTTQKATVIHEQRIKYIEKERQAMVTRIGSATADEKARLFTSLLDTPTDSAGLSRDTTILSR